MEGNDDKPGNKKLFIITPQELAELGVLNKLSNNKFDKTDEKCIPTTSTSFNELDSLAVLKSAIQKKMSSNNQLMFKKPVEPETSKVKKSHSEKLLNTDNKPAKKSNKKDTASNRALVPKIKNKSVRKIEIDKKPCAPADTMKRKKSVSVLSNTSVSFSKEDLHKIISEVPYSNVNDTSTSECNEATIVTNPINNDAREYKKPTIAKKTRYIPNIGDIKRKQNIKLPIANMKNMENTSLDNQLHSLDKVEQKNSNEIIKTGSSDSNFEKPINSSLMDITTEDDKNKNYNKMQINNNKNKKISSDAHFKKSHSIPDNNETIDTKTTKDVGSCSEKKQGSNQETNESHINKLEETVSALEDDHSNECADNMQKIVRNEEISIEMSKRASEILITNEVTGLTENISSQEIQEHPLTDLTKCIRDTIENKEDESNKEKDISNIGIQRTHPESIGSCMTEIVPVNRKKVEAKDETILNSSILSKTTEFLKNTFDNVSKEEKIPKKSISSSTSPQTRTITSNEDQITHQSDDDTEISSKNDLVAAKIASCIKEISKENIYLKIPEGRRETELFSNLINQDNKVGKSEVVLTEGTLDYLLTDVTSKDVIENIEENTDECKSSKPNIESQGACFQNIVCCVNENEKDAENRLKLGINKNCGNRLSKANSCTNISKETIDKVITNVVMKLTESDDEQSHRQLLIDEPPKHCENTTHTFKYTSDNIRENVNLVESKEEKDSTLNTITPSSTVIRNEDQRANQLDSANERDTSLKNDLVTLKLVSSPLKISEPKVINKNDNLSSGNNSNQSIKVEKIYKKPDIIKNRSRTKTTTSNHQEEIETEDLQLSIEQPKEEIIKKSSAANAELSKNKDESVDKTTATIVKKKVGRPKKHRIDPSTTAEKIPIQYKLSVDISSEGSKVRKSKSHSVSGTDDYLQCKKENDDKGPSTTRGSSSSCLLVKSSDDKNQAQLSDTNEPKMNSLDENESNNNKKKSVPHLEKLDSSLIDNKNDDIPKKKRGRKPKSERLPSPVQEKIDLLTEISRSGRKRLKINYVELEGNYNENIQTEGKRKRGIANEKDEETTNSNQLLDQHRPVESTPTRKRGRKSKVPSPKQEQIVSETSRNNKERDNSVEDREGNSSELKKDVNRSNENNLEDISGKKKKRRKSQCQFDQSPIEKNKKSEENVEKNPVANEHDELLSVTSCRENNIFDASVGQSINSDVNHVGKENVVCVICDKKVNKWRDHNEIVHNNLGWKQGEPYIYLDDIALLKKILNPLLTKNKSLICFKCKASYTKTTDFILHKEECDGIVCNGNVTCAVCNNLVTREKWKNHKLQHNNLAWRVGDPPLDLKNESLVTYILMGLYKAKKPLKCEKCKLKKKSVLGFLSHQRQCGLTLSEAQIPCEICGKKCLPSSMPTHMKQQHKSDNEDTPNKSDSDYFHVDLDAPLSKRRAAKKALTLLDQFSKGEKLEHFRFYVKQMDFDDNKKLVAFLSNELEQNKSLTCKVTGCEFKSETVPLLLDHMTTCPLKSDDYYACDKCYCICSTEDAIIEHLKLVHDRKVKSDIDYEQNNKSSDEEDIETENLLSSNTRTSFKGRKDQNNYKPLFILETSRKNSKKLTLYSHAFEFTFEFCQKHFRSKNLFENLYSKGMHLIDEQIEQYLPPSDVSCDVAKKIVNGFENVYYSEYKFKNFELFETEMGDANVTIFCGGPVRSLSWLPTPYTSLNEFQILAVAIGQDFNGTYRVDHNYSERTLIQFWNFGILKNRVDFQTPIFELGIIFDNGPIWHMEWCPTGCFNPENSDKGSRMGLLAVASSIMPVNIYSIPFLKEDEKGLFYKLSPVIKLQLIAKESEMKRTIFATKISWSRVSGCTSIAVGYSDGNVGLYNLNVTSNLIKFKDQNSIDVLLPYKILKAHTHFISVLSWIPIEGDRLLMTSSYDKNTFVWDLLTEYRYSTKKNKISTDGTWLTNWLSFVTANEEATLANGLVTLTQYCHREYLNENSKVSNSTGGTILTLSSSDWLNGFVHANTVGEIIGSFPHQMLFCQDLLKKGIPFRCLLGYTKLIDKSKSPEKRAIVEKKKQEFLKLLPRKRAYTAKDYMVGKDPYDVYEPLQYQESINQYGVLFCDIKPGHTHTLKLTTYQSEYSKPNLYPLQEINKISFNPNRQASLYYAAGYQIGFIRVTYIKSLDTDAQIDKSEKR
ncbi:uncharacterized protein LOC130893122 [Diorhabda carinulata]|uniref:uncharacterized protein LOC130893122 n=1 Tax=Diorhabda carinulata TaxID=1163345 RepID=UPI0025A25574|nr:uncharacterized protein LOC130893122 [Diorhabda carinulata]XP_057654913.1 uncharacterized protein LOC130893122 [Diorhabda carinulata]